jgi:hypothetical protein
MVWIALVIALFFGIFMVAAIAHRAIINYDLYMPDFEDIL